MSSLSGTICLQSLNLHLENFKVSSRLIWPCSDIMFSINSYWSLLNLNHLRNEPRVDPRLPKCSPWGTVIHHCHGPKGAKHFFSIAWRKIHVCSTLFLVISRCLEGILPVSHWCADHIGVLSFLGTPFPSLPYSWQRSCDWFPVIGMWVEVRCVAEPAPHIWI